MNSEDLIKFWLILVLLTSIIESDLALILLLVGFMVAVIYLIVCICDYILTKFFDKIKKFTKK